MKLEQEFLQAQEKDLFVDDGRDNKQREKLFFSLRFHPDNYPQQHRELAKEMKAKLGEDCEQAIGTTVKNVLQIIVGKHGATMQTDGVDTEAILHPGRGHKGAWQEVYKWFWERYFPDWLRDWLWQQLCQQADAGRDWMRFTPAEGYKGLIVPPPREVDKPKIRANSAAYLYLDLPHANRYLLLLNRGLHTRYCVCPSQAFAPQAVLSGDAMWMPQDGAMCRDFQFDEAGNEEFLGIVVDKEISLPWLIPSEENPAPQWNGEQLRQLWESLQQQDWQAFYQEFEVVE